MICLILIPLLSQTVLIIPSAQQQLTLPRNLYHIYIPWWGRLVDFDIVTRISYDPERRTWIRRKKENETGNFRPPLIEHRAIMCSLLALSNPFEGNRIYIKCRMACWNLYFPTEEPFGWETNYKPWSQHLRNIHPSNPDLFLYKLWVFLPRVSQSQLQQTEWKGLIIVLENGFYLCILCSKCLPRGAFKSNF